jgi:hypothetical protein
MLPILGASRAAYSRSGCEFLVVFQPALVLEPPKARASAKPAAIGRFSNLKSIR